jgi:hypothetical protein
VIVSAIAPNGIPQSTVEIADAVWETAQEQIRREAEARGFSLDPVTWVPGPDSQYAPERRCDTLPSAQAWLETLDPREE